MNPKDEIGRSKPRIASVVPPASIIHEARAMEFGAFHAGKDGNGYGPFNWREQPVTLSVYLDAIERHLLAFIDGENEASDSKVHHLAHVKAGCGIILDALETGNLVDDRPKKGCASRLLVREPAPIKCKCPSFKHEHYRGIGCDMKWILGHDEIVEKRQGDQY